MTVMRDSRVRARLLGGFDDPAVGRERWDALVARGDAPFISQAWLCQSGWWERAHWGKRLLLIAVERAGEVVALAPLYADEGVVYFVGTGAADYLDFIGDVSGPGVLDTILASVREQVPDLARIELYNILDRSRTGSLLRASAARLGLHCMDEGGYPAPVVDLAGQPEAALAATRKKSLLRHQRALERDGALSVLHLSDGAAIMPHLGGLFEQHVARWATTASPSRFRDPASREAVRRWVRGMGETGWLRFTRVDWQGRPVAFHLGSCYLGRYYWGTPTFDVALGRYSPGEVLLGQVLRAAIDEGASLFDFGLGDEPYKLRFATSVPRVHAWCLEPATPSLAERAAPTGGARTGA